MSFDLYAWKAPLVSEDEASTLVRGFYDDNDVDVFERSEDLLRFHDEPLETYLTLETVAGGDIDDAPTYGWDS